PFACPTSMSVTCAYEAGYIGCCEPNKDCVDIKTACIDYPAVSAGACRDRKDYHTIC
ncbi:hypothetical protein E4U43_006824, partial [Claviceps pusilla]